MHTYLAYQYDKSHKFWQIALEGKTFITTCGKAAATDKARANPFDSEEKSKKGYLNKKY